MTATILTRILDDLRAYPSEELPAVTGDLVVQYDNDSVLHVLSDIPDVIAIATFVLDCEDNEDFTYRNGILKIHTAPQPLYYQPLYQDAELSWDGEGVNLAEPIIAHRVKPLECLCSSRTIHDETDKVVWHAGHRSEWCGNPGDPWVDRDSGELQLNGWCSDCVDKLCTWCSDE